MSWQALDEEMSKIETIVGSIEQENAEEDQEKIVELGARPKENRAENSESVSGKAVSYRRFSSPRPPKVSSKLAMF